MPVMTSGRLNLTPITLNTKASLLAIRNEMRATGSRYQGQVPGGGYGSVDDDDYVLRGRALGRPKGGDARVEDAEGEWRERLLARYWWNEPDNSLNDMPDIDERLLWSLYAVDLMIVGTDKDDELAAYISMMPSGRGFMSSVVESLRATLEEVDSSATVNANSSPVGFADDDFFRWLLYRYRWFPKIGRLEIKAVNDIASQDTLKRSAALRKGADIDSRPELLAMLSGKSTMFGPAKFQLFDNDLNLDATLELRQDGGFSPNVNACQYVKKPPLPSAFRLKLVNDLAFGTIPTLRSAFYADTTYLKTGRDRLVKYCRNRLSKVLSGAPLS